ncbi:hypothetical protein NDU88_005494 [Pleurodeles waltl]|uniref:Uncharacterized protein n=1 Tax=Pleurodeles waltl TaxID=8319 RepID=A0AAV7NQJ4_PLEWA|nr:hypothetical protein NDU88_005494 [Pleurodeles waltl]
MGTPTDARKDDLRVPSQKGKTDSDKGWKEFSWRTLPGEEKETPRKEQKEADDAQTDRERRAEGESRYPETSACRHDPGGSWLNKVPRADAIKRPKKDTDQMHYKGEEV